MGICGEKGKSGFQIVDLRFPINNLGYLRNILAKLSEMRIIVRQAGVKRKFAVG